MCHAEALLEVENLRSRTLLRRRQRTQLACCCCAVVALLLLELHTHAYTTLVHDEDYSTLRVVFFDSRVLFGRRL